jgi:hypothetical protein
MGLASCRDVEAPGVVFDPGGLCFSSKPGTNVPFG